MAAMAAITVTLLLGAVIASAFSPEPNTYTGTAIGGGHVSFSSDTHHAHRFRFADHEVFSDTPLVHHTNADGTVTWNFHGHNEHYRAKGHWVSPKHVHGSICNLVLHPDACRDVHHLQTYDAYAKTKQ
jgi:hypothetical protein